MLLSARLRQPLYRAAADPGDLDGRDQRLGADDVVPQVQRLHLAERGHALAVRPDTGEDCLLADGFVEAIVTARDHEACRETFEVPLPRRRESLVEVVDGEDDLPLRGGKTPEVDQVGVSAALHANAGRRSARQVHRHGERRAAVEGEGRQDHAPVAERQELGEAPFVGLEHQADRVRPARGCLPGRV